MAIVNMKQAAELAGVSRTTLWRKAKDGVLSTTKFPDGSPGVDTAELFRVFPRVSDNETQVTHEETAMQLEKQVRESAIRVLEKEVVLLREQLHDYKDRERRLLDQVDSLASTIKQIEHRPEPAPIKQWWKFWGRA